MPTLKAILGIVSIIFGAPIEEIESISRSHKTSRARSAYYYLASKKTNQRHDIIARFINRPSHSSVSYGVNDAIKRIGADKDYEDKIIGCLSELNKLY